MNSTNNFPPLRTAWTVVCILFLASVTSYLDRYMLSLFVAPIRHALGLSDTQISLLQGFAFAMVYACMGLPFGRIVDRRNRRNLIIFGLVVWSSMTIWCGLSRSFAELFVARIGVGVGEACLGPAAFSLLADYFAPSHRGRALATYNMSTYVGAGASLLLGGAILRALAGITVIPLPLLGAVAPWQIAFLAAGAPGFFLAMILIYVKEPERKELLRRGGAEHRTRVLLLPYIRSRLTTFVPLYVSYALTAVVGYVVVAWVPSFYIRHYGLRPADVGLVMGTVAIVGGIAGCLVSGYLSDRWVMRDLRGGRFRIPLLWWPVAVVSIICFTQSPSLGVSLIFFCLLTFGSAVGLSSAPAAIQDAVPNELRGQASALHFILAGLIGLGVAPTLVALVTDHIFHNDNALGLSLMAVLLPVAVVGLIASVMGQGPYDRVRRQVGESHRTGPKVFGYADSMERKDAPDAI
ncbi:spinster family MFS transporter [Paraburkholderia tropica]|uniref:spinster family MFS transporter n=1 Tax=Paraburkholderia tropica TaxID=92647 RepID=UPI002AB0F20D|nr:MFS transporter [Paraburkholderia tropica]